MSASSSTISSENNGNLAEITVENQISANQVKMKIRSIEDSENSFLNMPDVVIDKVLGKLDFRQIQILRKTCHSLRNFIDDSRISGTLSTVKIRSSRNEITVVYDSKYTVYYRTHEFGCQVDYKRKAKLLRKENSMEIFIEDLDAIIGNRKKPLEIFGFYEKDDGIFLPKLHKFLSSKLRPLSTVTLLMEVNWPSGVLQILPFVCPGKLKNIRIFGNFFIDIEKISNLEQWRSAEKMTLGRWMNSKNLEKFGHFREVFLTFDVVTLEVLMGLKENSLLLDLPDRPMFTLMEKMDFRDIQVLRKVCHSLRNFIDDFRILGTLFNIKITSSLNRITVVYDNNYGISYTNSPEGCLIEHQENSKLLNTAGNLKIFMDDLKLILGPRRDSEIQLLVISVESQVFFDEFQKILASRPRPFRVETFTISGSQQFEICKILPYLDPYKLKNIRIWNAGNSGILEIDEILELDQFKMAERITVKAMIEGKFLRNFCHFKNVLLKVDEVKSQDLEDLKNNFLLFFTNLEQFLFIYWKLNDDQNFLFRKNRYFKIPNSEDVLSIRHVPINKFINFRKIKIGEVPPNKFVEN